MIGQISLKEKIISNFVAVKGGSERRGGGRTQQIDRMTEGSQRTQAGYTGLEAHKKSLMERPVCG